jgi:hypothetical protein
MPETVDDPFVTVCAECLRASCWQTAFPCEAWRTASTKQMRVSELRPLHLEDARFWDSGAERTGA